MNMIDFEGKKVLVRPNTLDKGKGKEIVIGNAREADENHKISCRKVVAERTPDEGERPSRPPALGGQYWPRSRNPCYASRTVRHTGADGPGPRQTVRIIPADGPALLKARNGHVPSNHDDQR
jgi:hypothetical protein